MGTQPRLERELLPQLTAAMRSQHRNDKVHSRTCSVSAKTILVQDFCNATLNLLCPSVPNHTQLHLWPLPVRGRRMHTEPLHSLPHPQPCSKCHALRVRVRRLPYPGRVEELDPSGGLLLDYLLSFCFVHSFLCHSWDQSPGSESSLTTVVLCKHLLRTFSRKADHLKRDLLG